MCLAFSYFSIVGETGFEPATPWSQTKCANRTALHPDTFVVAGAKLVYFFRSAKD